MDFDTFKVKYAETMMNYQRIENDIKCIYAYMRAGDVTKHFADIENKTLGRMIRELKDLDKSDGKPYINSNIYNFLEQICDNRNHWAHIVFLEFIYKNNWINSKGYQKQCAKLKKDHDRVQVASDILEKLELNIVLVLGSRQRYANIF